MRKKELEAIKLLKRSIRKNFGRCKEWGGYDCGSCRAQSLYCELEWLEIIIEMDK